MAFVYFASVRSGGFVEPKKYSFPVPWHFLNRTPTKCLSEELLFTGTKWFIRNKASMFLWLRLWMEFLPPSTPPSSACWCVPGIKSYNHEVMHVMHCLPCKVHLCLFHNCCNPFQIRHLYICSDMSKDQMKLSSAYPCQKLWATFSVWRELRRIRYQRWGLRRFKE